MILKWIKDNLGESIRTVIVGTCYTEDWLAGMACRETGFLIQRYAGLPFDRTCSLMRGDFSQRPGEKEKQFHGYGFWQIDINSYPDHVRSGDWKNPLRNAMQAVLALEAKRKYLVNHLGGLTGDAFDRALTAAYNCGEGSVMHAVINKQDIDHFTFNQDYSKSVWQFREQYRSLQ